MSKAVQVDLELRLEIQDFLIYEAECLDDRRFEEWLEHFTSDVSYKAPARVTKKNPASNVVDAIGHFDDNIHSLTLRVKRLGTDVAWAEDPPSLTRRFVTGIRIRRTEKPDVLDVRSNLCLFRSRGDRGLYDLIVGERFDTFQQGSEGWKISSRRIVLDQSSLSTKNLGVFL